MIPTLLALALALADPLGFPTPPGVARAAAATPAAAPAPAPPPAATLTLPSAGLGLDALILPVAALLALALAALFATRRKQGTARLVQVLETTSIGPKRALVVVRVGEEVMVIGSSEAGLQLLAARPAGLEPRAAEWPARLQAVPDPAPESAPSAHPVLKLLARLRGRPAAPPPGAFAAPEDPPAFDALLAESAEDQELRRKLARGQPGSVR
jgi:flagellar biogenesis protein FliO